MKFSLVRPQKIIASSISDIRYEIHKSENLSKFQIFNQTIYNCFVVCLIIFCWKYETSEILSFAFFAKKRI